VDWDQSEGSWGGGGGKRFPEGTYTAKVVSAKRGTSPEKGSPRVEVKLKFTDGPKKVKGEELTDYIYLSSKALPRAMFFLEQLDPTGKLAKAAKDKGVFPIKAIIGKEVGVDVGDEEYEGKLRSRVQNFVPADEVGDEDQEEELKEDELDEDDDDDDGEDLDEMDRAELKAYIKENDLDVRVKKSMDEDDIREAIREEEGDEDDDEEEDKDELEDLNLDDL
jgi:hypothetical protein